MKISRRKFLAGTGLVVASGLVGPPAAAAGTIPETSRDSVFTRGGAGPRYWSTYGWNYPNNAPIPEPEWQANIDWVAATFASSGYDLICTDGWVDGTQNTTANGYIQSYSDSWAHDWAYWAQYLAAKGLKLGVYYNPLWITKSAVDNPSVTVAGRPDVSVSSLVNAGDTLNSNGQLYWLDVTRDGAKEYVQCYVDYFKNLGAVYLRTDFWSWYESGYDANVGTVGVAHGSANYATALSWVDEAAGDDVEVSVVMPNLFGHGANELLHGDLVRIDADVTSGGWAALSAGRQSWQSTWSQWFNPFGGFTGFSDVAGRGRLILDGDFLLLSSFASDDERRTAITLFTVNGSPLAIADRHDTIGGNASFYTNPEVLALHDAGLVAKPFYYNGDGYDTDAGSRDSERWLGQLPDGSWVVALFNRNDGPSPTTKSVDFAADLGLSGAAAVRDLWARADLGGLTGFSASLAPHACRLVTVTPTGTPRYAAEVAARGGGAHFNNDHTGHAGFGFVDGLGTTGASVLFAVAAPAAGSYQVTVRYANATGAASTMTLVAQDESRAVLGGPAQVTFPALADWNTWSTASATLTLRQGVNLLTLARTDADTGAINLDYLDVTPS